MAKRRVGLDVQVLQSRERSGYGYYVAGLFDAVVRHADAYNLEIVGLESRTAAGLSTPKRWWHDYVEINREARREGVAIIHQPCFSAPKSSRPVVWTLHDLRQIVMDEPMSFSAGLYWKKWLPYSARFADRIVVTSQNTKDDAVRLLGLNPDDISLITIGLPAEIARWRASRSFKQATESTFGVVEPYFSTLGTIQPIKNIPFLIDVFVLLRREFDLKHQLVIVGSHGWGYADVHRAIKRHKLVEGRDVVITGYVSDQQKWQLLGDSDMFLFPSLYEGFGIPPIEAQALGVPVICSDTSSLPWVVGDGAVLASPTEASSWAAAYATAVKRRRELIARGRANVGRFDWNDIGKQWCDLYRSLVEGG